MEDNQLVPIASSRRWNFKTNQWEDDPPDPFYEPLPAKPTKPPLFIADEDALTITVRPGQRDEFIIDLTDFKTWEFEQEPKWWKELEYLMRSDPCTAISIRDEIEHIAWNVFNGQQFYRSVYLFPDELPQEAPFDFFGALKAGARLDWGVGRIQWPEESRRGAAPLLEISDEEGDDTELISDRYLCRGGAMLIAAPTGIGKSSLSMQLSVSFALGRECLGFKPARPLATLIIQAENDSGDLAEMRDGVFTGLDLTGDEEVVADRMVRVELVDDVTGFAFIDRITPMIRKWQPDILVIDPLLSFIGGDISKQEVASQFLRLGLTRLLRRAGCGAVVSHHTGKPPRDGRGQQSADYLGLGSSELSNWARAIVSLSRTEGDDSIFKMEMGKRGGRALRGSGAPALIRHLRHARDIIFWEEAAAEQVAVAATKPTKEAVLALVSPGKPKAKSKVKAEAVAKGMAERRADGFIAELVDDGTLHVWLVPRPKTNPLKLLAREPQPATLPPELLLKEAKA